MKELRKEEMKRVEAGADPLVVTGIVGVVITFLIGVFHGYTNPESCRN